MSLKVHGFARHAHTIQTNALGMSSKLIAFFEQTQGVGYMSKPVVDTSIRSVVHAEAPCQGHGLRTALPDKCWRTGGESSLSLAPELQ